MYAFAVAPERNQRDSLLPLITCATANELNKAGGRVRDPAWCFSAVLTPGRNPRTPQIPRSRPSRLPQPRPCHHARLPRWCLLLPQLRRLRDPGFPSWCELRSCLLRSHRVSAEITWNAGDFRHEWQTPVVGVNIVEGQPYSCAPGQPRGFDTADVSPGRPG
jgi:hypothetical protein